MKIIKPYAEIISDTENLLNNIEIAARTCYKSDFDGEEGKLRLIRHLIRNGHEAMLEHASVTVRFVVDRGVSHELVRHRVASFAQESTRYCDYSNDRFGNEITFIKPCFWADNDTKMAAWEEAMYHAEQLYFEIREQGGTPQEARSVLPNSTKTEVIMTANLREWRHFFKLRAIGTTGKPHPQMWEVAYPLLFEFAGKIPEVFADLAKEAMEKKL